MTTPDPNAAPPVDPDSPQARAQKTTETMMANPSMIPPKFKNEDGTINQTFLFQSVLEMEKGQSDPAAPAAPSAQPASAPDADASTTPSPDTGTNTAESLADALTEPEPPAADEMWGVVAKEFASTGTLSEGTVKSLLAAGVPQEMIVAAVEGNKAKQAQDMVRAAEMVGGKESLDATLTWAKENLSIEERKAIIPLLRGPQAETVLMGLHQRRLMAKPESGQVNTNTVGAATLPTGDPNANLKPFTDYREQQAAMTDPRYKTDPAYRQEVETRLILGAGFSIER